MIGSLGKGVIDRLPKAASRLSALPGLRWISPPAAADPSDEDLAGFLRSQELAQAAVAEIARHVREGWTEQQAASLLNTYLQDCGVRSFFHRAFAWFGDRTRFEGIRRYDEFSPRPRVLRPGDVYILDVAPIYRGYLCDIGFTACLGENAAWSRAEQFLRDLRGAIPSFFREAIRGADVWDRIDERFREAGYDCIHALYPFSVVGHRVHAVASERAPLALLNFGWQSYWEFLSRGLFGQLLNRDYSGDLRGLWAIEPHLGDPSGFGAKFEEILVVTDQDAYWLADREATCSREKTS